MKRNVLGTKSDIKTAIIEKDTFMICKRVYFTSREL